MISVRDRIRGTLLAGAVGDSLGAPIEFDSLNTIREAHGPSGVTGPLPSYGKAFAITDDTQMTLFVAEGLVLAARADALQTPSERLRIMHRAHLRWLRTQGETSRHPTFERCQEGWLLEVAGLHSRRAPGNTCLSGLRSDRMGSIEEPLNQSKGCGGVMRAAPVGLALGVDDPFRMGAQVAALTHGHPSGFLSAGFLAFVIRSLLLGDDLEESCESAFDELDRWPGHEETSEAVRAALMLARAGPPTPERVESLGGAWVGEEALAVAVYCVLASDDLETALLLAVNHGGDSDSTGAIAGNLAGAIWGPDTIPGSWLDQIELRTEIKDVAARREAECSAGAFLARGSGTPPI